MDINTRLAERFEKSFELKTKQARLESRQITLGKEKQEAQDAIRAADARLQELQTFPADLLAEQADNMDRLLAARFDENFAIRTDKLVHEAKLTALDDEHLDITANLELIAASIIDIQTIPAELLAAPAQRGPGRPRGSRNRIAPAAGDHTRRARGSDDRSRAISQELTVPDRAVATTASRMRRSRGPDEKEFSRPGLYVCGAIPAFRALTEEDQVQSNRGGAFTMLSKDHPTIVRLDGRWAEIWCASCGVNAIYTKKTYFLGMAGIHKHMCLSACYPWTGKKFTLEEVSEVCGRHYLSEQELEDLQSREKQVRMRWFGMEQEEPTSDVDDNLDIASIAASQERYSTTPGISETDVQSDRDVTERSSEVAELLQDFKDEPQIPDHTPEQEEQRTLTTSPLSPSIDMDRSLSDPLPDIVTPSSVVRDFKHEFDNGTSPTSKRKSPIDEFLESGRAKMRRTIV